jgi:hypothetical protein
MLLALVVPNDLLVKKSRRLGWWMRLARARAIGLSFKVLVAIHAAPRWTWTALVDKALRDKLTQDQTIDFVRNFKGAPEARWPFAWDRIGEHVVKGTLSLDAVQGMIDTCQHYASSP